MATAYLINTKRARAVQTAVNELNAISRGLGIELPPFPQKKWPNQIHADADKMEHIAKVLTLIREQVAPNEKPDPDKVEVVKPAQPFKKAGLSLPEPPTNQVFEDDEPEESDELEEESTEEGDGEEGESEDDSEGEEDAPQMTPEEARILERHKAGKKERNPEFGGRKLDFYEQLVKEKKPQSEYEVQELLRTQQGVGKSTAANIMADLKRRNHERELLQSALKKQAAIEAKK